MVVLISRTFACTTAVSHDFVVAVSGIAAVALEVLRVHIVAAGIRTGTGAREGLVGSRSSRTCRTAAVAVQQQAA